MNRRELIGAAGIAAVGIAVPLGRAARADDSKKDHHHDDKAHQACIDACEACEKACRKAFHHCYGLVVAGKKEHAEAMHLTAACAKFCDLSADMMTSHSKLMAYSCAACAEACKVCAEECAKLDSPEMKACTEACLACEKACRDMVKALGEHAHH